MKISSAVILAVAALALAAPASAKTTINKGEKLCKAVINAQTPPPKSIRIDKAETRMNDAQIVFAIKGRSADGASQAYTCTVDRSTDAAAVSPAA